MKQYPLRRWTIIAALFLLSSQASAQDLIEVSPAARAALGIEVRPPHSAGRFAGAEASGAVIAPPGRLQSAATPYAGVVVQPIMPAGGVVEAGDRLAVLYSPDYAAAAAELESNRLASLHLAAVAERASRLQAEGLMSLTETQAAEHDAESARLRYEARRARLARVEAEPGAPDRFAVLAPVGGVVAHLHAGSGDAVAASSAIASIFQGDAYWARAQAPERTADLLALGEQVRIGDHPEAGEIVAIDPEIDPTTRSLEIMVRLPADGPWRLGRLVDLVFEAETPDGAIALPIDAMIRIDGEETVFVEAEGGFEPRRIQILARSREAVLVSGSISLDDRVAVSGLAALKNMVEGG